MGLEDVAEQGKKEFEEVDEEDVEKFEEQLEELVEEVDNLLVSVVVWRVCTVSKLHDSSDPRSSDALAP